jgi:hypothetical protein
VEVSPIAAGALSQEDRMDGMSLLDVLRGVMLDPAEQAAYNADPGAYLQQYGYDDVDPADLSEAFGLVADTLPPDQAQAAWAAGGHEPFGALGRDTDGAAFESHGLDAADLDADVLDDGVPGADAPGEGFGDGSLVIDLDADDVATLSFGVGEPPDGDAALGGGRGLDLDGDGLPDAVGDGDFADGGGLDGGGDLDDLGPDADGDGVIDAFDLDPGGPGDPDDGFTDDDGDGIADDFDAGDGGFGAHQLGGFGGEDDPADTDIGSF